MTTPEADEQAASAPQETPGQQPPPTTVSPPPLEAPSAESEPSPFPDGAEIQEPLPPATDAAMAMPMVAPRAVAVAEREVTYVPLSVTIGDGFKFGCGFFLASVVALLVGFVLLAALFVLTGLFGLNLPIGR